ncbi:MAG: twin-arginine translocation signal domain-containing protein, partial [Undibacterium sp.]|nr:twin-arginine translocation signal domain-containing protein [Undibacterium sp.]
MSHSRRQFMQWTAATAGLFSLGGLTTKVLAAGTAATPKRILVLGGTGFLGPAIVNAAQARGHTLTLFNRGRTRAGLFPDVEKRQGDRDPKKGEGLS